MRLCTTALLATFALLPACGRQPQSQAPSAGARLENAAVAAGMVVDPRRVTLIGAWSRETDRLCVVPGHAGTLRVGVLIDYGEGQGCAAAGTLRQRGDSARLAFGSCRFDAAIDGDRIVFPAELPSACESLCTGRASLSALAVDRVSASASEAAQLRSPAGQPLCGG
jgi:hypothetical protein